MAERTSLTHVDDAREYLQIVPLHGRRAIVDVQIDDDESATSTVKLPNEPGMFVKERPSPLLHELQVARVVDMTIAIQMVTTNPHTDLGN